MIVSQIGGEMAGKEQGGRHCLWSAAPGLELGVGHCVHCGQVITNRMRTGHPVLFTMLPLQQLDECALALIKGPFVCLLKLHSPIGLSFCHVCESNRPCQIS